MKVPLGMALRQATGLAESLLRLIGLDRAVPDFSTLSRRRKTLKVNIPCRGWQGSLHLLIDSTGTVLRPAICVTDAVWWRPSDRDGHVQAPKARSCFMRLLIARPTTRLEKMQVITDR